MLVSSIYKGLCRTRLLCYGGVLASLSNVSNGRTVGYTDWKKSRKTNVSVTNRKSYSTDTQTPNVVLPPLCDFPPAIWPSIINTIQNLFTFNMVIKRKIDTEMNEEEFMNGSKQALVVVSRALAGENYDQLENLVTPDVIEHMKQKIPTLSIAQKQCIPVQSEDVYFMYPHSVKVLHGDDKSQNRIFIEILMVYHYLQDFGRMKRNGEAIPIDKWTTEADKIFTANYRFIREYTQNVESSWIVNVVNHFTPAALK